MWIRRSTLAFADGAYNSPKVFDRPRMEKFLADTGKYADEFDPPVEGDLKNPQGYFWQNPAFSFSDAMAYYCVLRHLKPAHVLEVGSGFRRWLPCRRLKRTGAANSPASSRFPCLGFRRSANV